MGLASGDCPLEDDSSGEGEGERSLVAEREKVNSKDAIDGDKLKRVVVVREKGKVRRLRRSESHNPFVR